VLVLTSVLSYVIPDVPHELRKQMRRERNVINHVIVSTELDRARGRIASGSRPAAGSRDNSALCTLTSATHSN